MAISLVSRTSDGAFQPHRLQFHLENGCTLNFGPSSFSGSVTNGVMDLDFESVSVWDTEEYMKLLKSQNKDVKPTCFTSRLAQELGRPQDGYSMSIMDLEDMLSIIQRVSKW